MKNFLRKVIPKNLWSNLKEIAWAYTDWVSYKSYSSEGEDMILRKIFYKKEKGFYVDIGAYHPKKASNTYYFYKKGWSGINIDAMPGSMKLFNRLRKRDINLEIPIGREGEVVKYYEFEDKALNGFESDSLLAKDQSKVQNQLRRIHQLKSQSLNSILETYLPKSQTIDFISIDVEGQEFQILESFEFEKYKPSWLLIEIWQLEYLNCQSHPLVNLLISKGYSVKAKCLNTVFLKKKLTI